MLFFLYLFFCHLRLAGHWRSQDYCPSPFSYPLFYKYSVDNMPLVLIITLEQTGYELVLDTSYAEQITTLQAVDYEWDHVVPPQDYYVAILVDVWNVVIKVLWKYIQNLEIFGPVFLSQTVSFNALTERLQCYKISNGIFPNFTRNI